MRVALLLIPLTACAIQGGECDIDDHCGSSEVCGRDHACTSPSNVRVVTARWTIDGVPANEAPACTGRDLYIDFLGLDRDDTLGFRPVPCAVGQFSVDKLPLRFESVELGAEDG